MLYIYRISHEDSKTVLDCYNMLYIYRVWIFKNCFRFKFFEIFLSKIFTKIGIKHKNYFSSYRMLIVGKSCFE